MQCVEFESMFGGDVPEAAKPAPTARNVSSFILLEA
jgi:hypothetical protein